MNQVHEDGQSNNVHGATLNHNCSIKILLEQEKNDDINYIFTLKI